MKKIFLMKQIRFIFISLLIICLGNVLAQETKEPPKSYFSLSQSLVDFGSVNLGATKTINVTFTNTGKKPLIIFNVYTNCGCTEVDFPKEPFAPGKSGTLKISYSATEGEGVFSKTITVNTNAKNKKENLKIEGIVVPK